MSSVNNQPGELNTRLFLRFDESRIQKRNPQAREQFVSAIVFRREKSSQQKWASQRRAIPNPNWRFGSFPFPRSTFQEFLQHWTAVPCCGIGLCSGMGCGGVFPTEGLGNCMGLGSSWPQSNIHTRKTLRVPWTQSWIHTWQTSGSPERNPGSTPDKTSGSPDRNHGSSSKGWNVIITKVDVLFCGWRYRCTNPSQKISSV